MNIHMGVRGQIAKLFRILTLFIVCGCLGRSPRCKTMQCLRSPGCYWGMSRTKPSKSPQCKTTWCSCGGLTDVAFTGCVSICVLSDYSTLFATSGECHVGYRTLWKIKVSALRYSCLHSVVLSVGTLRIHKSRISESKFPGNSLWTWEFHPSESRICLSPTLWYPDV